MCGKIDKFVLQNFIPLGFETQIFIEKGGDAKRKISSRWDLKFDIDKIKRKLFYE